MAAVRAAGTGRPSVVPVAAAVVALLVCTGASAASARGREGRKISLGPFYMEGPGYRVVPMALCGRWRHADGSESTWVTPFYHRTVDEDGSLRHVHAFNYLAGRDYEVFFPFAYRVGERSGVPPFYFRGPTYSVCPPLLSGRWRHRDGARSTWITPFYHKTVEADGTLRHKHLLVFPMWGKRRRERKEARRRAAEEAERKAAEERRRREEEARKKRESVPALIETLKGGDRRERRWAVALLREKGAEAGAAVPAVVEALVEALGDARFDMRRSAADALAGIGPAAVPALVKALEDADVMARWGAAYALGEMGPRAKEAAVPVTTALERALGDADRRVRARAAWAVEKIEARE